MPGMKPPPPDWRFHSSWQQIYRRFLQNFFPKKPYHGLNVLVHEVS
jgi:hypothetical protein